MNAAVLTVDIGNSRSHWALYEEGHRLDEGDIPSGGSTTDFRPLLTQAGKERSLAGVIACSVSPRTTTTLSQQAALAHIPCVFLNHKNVGSLRLGYDRPEEIGPDRLANALGAMRLYAPPVVIIDMGTAVTIDAVTRTNGYEGGAIAPGIAMLSDYLAEKTALLPRIDLTQASLCTGIGRSTREAMEIGCTAGFDGLIAGLTETIAAEVESIDGTPPTIIATGGSFDWVKQGYVGRLPYHPRLALEGLHSKVEDLLLPLIKNS